MGLGEGVEVRVFKDTQSELLRRAFRELDLLRALVGVVFYLYKRFGKRGSLRGSIDTAPERSELLLEERDPRQVVRSREPRSIDSYGLENSFNSGEIHLELGRFEFLQELLWCLSANFFRFCGSFSS